MTQKDNCPSVSSDTIPSLVAAFYGYLSFPPGGQPDYAVLATLFHSSAVIMPPGQDTDGVVKALGVSDFLRMYQPQLEEYRQSGFSETEIFGSTSAFGNVAQHSSAYQVKIGEISHAFRGINLFQFVRENGRWWIASLVWDRSSRS